jgi:hypothetical protein
VRLPPTRSILYFNNSQSIHSQDLRRKGRRKGVETSHSLSYQGPQESLSVAYKTNITIRIGGTNLEGFSRTSLRTRSNDVIIIRPKMEQVWRKWGQLRVLSLAMTCVQGASEGAGESGLGSLPTLLES